MTDSKEVLKGYVNQARKGDCEAFEALVKYHTNYVFNLAYNLTAGNRSDADDLTQMTFVRAFQAVKRFEGRSEFKTWLHRITVNLWKNMVRSQKRRKYFQHQSINEDPSEDSAGCHLELEENGLGPLEKVEQSETSQIVRAAIGKIPPDEREVTILRDIEGYSYEEIADLCHIPLGTVKSRLSRARRLLRNALDPILGRSS
ncbi:RNA polymerase sigma factor [bacterium]|nr:RNA polymerase sigma factor [bacterium]